LPHAAFHMLGQLAEVRVAGIQLRPGIADADHGPPIEDIAGQSLDAHPCSMSEAMAVHRAEPRLRPASAVVLCAHVTELRTRALVIVAILADHFEALGGLDWVREAVAAAGKHGKPIAA